MPRCRPAVADDGARGREAPGRLTQPADRVVVVAAVVEEDGRYLVTRRPAGVHLAGMWEFPGGKVGSGETHAGALRREMQEELDSDVDVQELVFATGHDYPDRTVWLYFYRCRLFGTPRPLLGQDMRWVTREELRSLPFPTADTDLIRQLTMIGT
jgi:8-oxo-dGTP diphosphatase